MFILINTISYLYINFTNFNNFILISFNFNSTILKKLKINTDKYDIQIEQHPKLDLFILISYINLTFFLFFNIFLLAISLSLDFVDD